MEAAPQQADRARLATTSRALRRNGVLAALPPGALPTAELELLVLDQGDVLHEIGHPAETVVFPLTCVISLATGDRRQATGDGVDAVDVTTVGREGLVGLAGLLGATVHDARAVCRVPGEALRLPVGLARRLLVADVEGLAVLHRYIAGSVADLMQRIACNRLHSNERRCACWLAKTSDRVGEDSFRLTHATLATMLGVRRATVTSSLALLQREDVVRSKHGTVTVLDRTALEAVACDCYRTFARQFAIASG